MARLSGHNDIAREWAPHCRITPVTLVFHGGGRATVRAEVADAFRALNLCLVAHDYRTRRADTGGYVCRSITGRPGVWSLHAYGIAVDINWQANPYGKHLVTDMPPAMRSAIKRIRTRSGVPVFRWGGDYTGNKDAMHWEVVCQRRDLATGIHPDSVPGGTATPPPTPPPPPPPPPKGLTVSDVQAIRTDISNVGRGVIQTKALVDLLRAELLDPVGSDGQTRADRMAAIPAQLDALDKRLDRIEAAIAALNTGGD